MKTIRSISFVLLMFLVMTSFSQCSSAKDVQEKAPVSYDQVYYQNWIAGVEGGGAGTNLFIPISGKQIDLDSVYFRGKVVKLEQGGKIEKPNEGFLFIGRFISEINKKKDMVMSSDPNAEFGNEMPKPAEKIPFDLKDDECVVSYKDGDKVKYFKIRNIVEKQTIAYPSAPPNKQ